MSNDKLRELFRDYVNSEVKLETMISKFDLVQCSNEHCDFYDLEENMQYHKWDIAGDEDKVCQQCRGEE